MASTPSFRLLFRVATKFYRTSTPHPFSSTVDTASSICENARRFRERTRLFPEAVRAFSTAFETMFDAYWHYISPFDWIILSFGTALLLFQLFAIFMRYVSDRTLFVQQLGRIQSACLQWTELLPVLGLIGTVMAMLNTFSEFDVSHDAGVDVVLLIRRFAPAMTTTLSGLFMVVLNLPLNLVLYLLIPNTGNSVE